MSNSATRAFVLGIDGAIGECVRQADTPAIDAFIAQGVATFDARSVLPSSSFPAWGSMFHGVGPDKHRLEGDHPIGEGVRWPSFMKLARRRWPEAQLASYSCWGPINSHIIEPSCRARLVSKPDRELVPLAVEYLRSHDPRVFFLHLDDIDHFGHSRGYRSPEYLRQISATDQHLGEILAVIGDRGWLEESLVVILSDHGGEGTGHGGDHPDCLNTFWACRGPGIRRGSLVEDGLSITDTAAVLARGLGLEAPEGWDAAVPSGVFT